jgi:hypothetical protein
VENETRYQAFVLAYSQALKPGTTREEVEAHLHREGKAFQKWTDRQQATPDDFVKIGSEPAPWYCNERNVYVRFNFRPHRSESVQTLMTDLRGHPQDTLESVALEYRLEVCL